MLPILLYASPAWSPWLKGSIDSLVSFQRRFVRRIAYKCGIGPESINLTPIPVLLDERDICLTKLILRNPDFAGFFDKVDTVTRAREIFVVPLAWNNTVLFSFRWRAFKRLSSS